MIAIQGAMKFNGGGHVNHSIFWNNLSPNGGGQPTGKVWVEKLVRWDIDIWDI